LELAERRVVEIEAIIARQVERVGELARDHHPVDEAEERLALSLKLRINLRESLDVMRHFARLPEHARQYRHHAVTLLAKAECMPDCEPRHEILELANSWLEQARREEEATCLAAPPARGKAEEE
jgi:hypothetical protein